MKKYLILIFVLIFISSVYAAVDCSQAPGRHGVEVDGCYYDCGEVDGVCPEDFFEAGSGLDCSANPDVDCEGVEVPPPEACGDCGDFDQSVCDVSACNDINCFWDTEWIDECLECNEYADMCCGYYGDEPTCLADNCELGCEWDGSECIEKVVTGECGNGIYEKESEECDGDEGLHVALENLGTELGKTACELLDLGTGTIGCFNSGPFACRIDITGCSRVVESEGSCGDDDVNVHEASETYEECDCGSDSCDTGVDCSDFDFGTGFVECKDCILDLENSCSSFTDLSCIDVDCSNCFDLDNTDVCDCCDGCHSCSDPDYGFYCSDSLDCRVSCAYMFPDYPVDCYDEDYNLIGCGETEEDCDQGDYGYETGDGVPTEIEEEPFPIFTWFNLILTSFILVGFYVFIHRKR